MLTARNLAAALSSLGADIETALLELVSVSPAVEANVRKELFRHCELPKLRYVPGRRDAGFLYIDTRCSQPVCAMHAVDQITRVLDDSDVIQYLKSKFQSYVPSIQEMCS